MIGSPAGTSARACAAASGAGCRALTRGSSASSASRRLVMIAVPTTAHDAAFGSSVSWKSDVCGFDERPFGVDVVVEHRRTQHDDEIVRAQLLDHAGANARQRAREQRVVFGKAAAAASALEIHVRPGALGQPDGQFRRAVAIDARTDDDRRSAGRRRTPRRARRARPDRRRSRRRSCARRAAAPERPNRPRGSRRRSGRTAAASRRSTHARSRPERLARGPARRSTSRTAGASTQRPARTGTGPSRASRASADRP